MYVVGLPVARYVYSFGTGEASGHWHNRLARRADNSEVPSSILGCPTISYRGVMTYYKRERKPRSISLITAAVRVGV